MTIFSGKSQIKVLMIGRDNITRKYFVEHDAHYFQDKYRIDPDAIVMTIEPGWFMSFGESSVPTIIFRENSIEPVSKKHPGTIPSPEEFGENVNRAANAIAILRAKSDSNAAMFTMILLLIACALGAGAVYVGYHDGQMIADNQNSINDLGTQISNLQGSQANHYNTTSGYYETGSGTVKV